MHPGSRHVNDSVPPNSRTVLIQLDESLFPIADNSQQLIVIVELQLIRSSDDKLDDVF